MSFIQVKVEGMENVTGLLKKLPDSLTRNTLLRAYRKSTKPMIRAIRQETPVIESGKTVERKNASGRTIRQTPGTLKRSIGNITGKSKTNVNVQVGARAGAKRKDDGYFAHFVHEGHKIKKTGGMTKKDPFIKRGFEQTKNVVSASVASSVAIIIEKNAKKLGL